MLMIMVSASCSCTDSLEGPGNTPGHKPGDDTEVTDQVRSDYVHASGIYIFDADGKMLILKGVGLGGWMVQEGYMLGTSGPQNEIRSRIEQIAGADATDRFYNDWLEYYITEADIRQIADFLHYSQQTIYNYKSKVRSKSDMDYNLFEEKVRHIGRLNID